MKRQFECVESALLTAANSELVKEYIRDGCREGLTALRSIENQMKLLGQEIKRLEKERSR